MAYSCIRDSAHRLQLYANLRPDQLRDIALPESRIPDMLLDCARVYGVARQDEEKHASIRLEMENGTRYEPGKWSERWVVVRDGRVSMFLCEEDYSGKRLCRHLALPPPLRPGPCLVLCASTAVVAKTRPFLANSQKAARRQWFRSPATSSR